MTEVHSTPNGVQDKEWLNAGSIGSAVYSLGALALVGVTAIKTIDLFKTWSLEEQARQNCYDAQSMVVSVVILTGALASFAVLCEVATEGLSLMTAACAVGSIGVIVLTVVMLGCLINRFLIPNNYGALGEQSSKMWGIL